MNIGINANTHKNILYAKDSISYQWEQWFIWHIMLGKSVIIWKIQKFYEFEFLPHLLHTHKLTVPHKYQADQNKKGNCVSYDGTLVCFIL